MTANEARVLSFDNHYNLKLIFKQIEDAALKGEFSIVIDNKIEIRMNTYLLYIGYNVTFEDGKTIISW